MSKDFFSIKGDTGIVTGGGKGLGRTYCRMLAEAGANVVVAEVDEHTGREAAEEIRQNGGSALFVHTDVRSRESVEAMLSVTLQEFGTVDFLVNNAGKWTFAPAEDLSPEDWHDVMDLNLNGLFTCCQVVGKEMVARKKGRIVNISSISGVIVNRPPPGNTSLDVSYFASKAGVIHLSRGLATQWAPHNVRVNVLAPGYTSAEGKPNENVPLGRGGRPEELVPPLIFLISEASSYITGAVLMVDGGYTLW